MEKRKPNIIQDKKLRGEWAESLFMTRASERGLAVSKPWGEMSPYDFVIGKTGRFISVQVKSTTMRLGLGYECTVRGGHKAYPAGSFDFLAAYAVPEDAWYIIPAELIYGKKSVALYPKSKTGKYETYREAWCLLREASQAGEEAENTPAIEAASQAALPATSPPAGALGRLQASMNFFRNQLERGGIAPPKSDEET